MRRKTLKSSSTEDLIRHILKRRTKKFITRLEISDKLRDYGRCAHSYILDKVLHQGYLNGSLVYADLKVIDHQSWGQFTIGSRIGYRSWKKKPKPAELDELVLELLYKVSPKGFTLDTLSLMAGMHYFGAEDPQPQVGVFRASDRLWKAGMVEACCTGRWRSLALDRLRLTTKGLLELHGKWGCPAKG